MYSFFCLNGYYFMTFLPVPCRFVVVGGVPGSRRTGGVFVSHVFNSSNVFGAVVPSEGWNVCAPGRDPLCHDGKCNILFQRSDFAQIKVISIVDIAFSSIHINYNWSKHLYKANVHLMRLVLQRGNATDTKMKVPVYDVAQEPCLQVNTRSDKDWVYSFWCLLSLSLCLLCRCGGHPLLWSAGEFCAQTVSMLETWQVPPVWVTRVSVLAWRC